MNFYRDFFIYHFIRLRVEDPKRKPPAMLVEDRSLH